MKKQFKHMPNRLVVNAGSYTGINWFSCGLAQTVFRLF